MFHHQHRRLSGSPQAPLLAFTTGNLPYPRKISSRKTLDNIPAALERDLPIVLTPSMTVLNETIEIESNSKHWMTPQASLMHLPDCIYASNTSSIHPHSNSNNQSDMSLSMKTVDIESESSSGWTNEGLPCDSMAKSTAINDSSEPVCTCQVLWELERDTDSIDRFKLFFKCDHLNVEWDYVQGSSDV
jgi:hypothetical protein